MVIFIILSLRNGVIYSNKSAHQETHYDLCVAISNANLFNKISAKKKVVWSNSLQPLASNINELSVPLTLVVLRSKPVKSESELSINNTDLVSARISGNALTLDYVANQYGTATINIRGTSNGETVDDAFVVTVTGVNDEPSFTKGSNVSVNEDAGAQTASGWASNISKGTNDPSSWLIQEHGVVVFAKLKAVTLEIWAMIS